jgi:hypothetical protein
VLGPMQVLWLLEHRDPVGVALVLSPAVVLVPELLVVLGRLVLSLWILVPLTTMPAAQWPHWQLLHLQERNSLRVRRPMEHPCGAWRLLRG